ncbi:zinc transporter ZIP13 isoform X4 [Mirounga leonina]|uniref:zinc transporter ZIP13 isoform X4 n=1 Tax=Mirounga leonina TaxID=9715 RepID=UPI00156BE6E6|nr:zinc transporter ZIP13 isoform X4 [Mirounga leonina]
MPGCPCPGCGMAGQRLLFFTALVLELLGGAGGSQPALRSRGPAAACRLDNKESESWGALLSGERLDTWICSLLGSLMVGLSGVFPLLVIPLEMGTMLRSEAGARRLKQLLSFALGGLLGNVFLHLLPEAWAYTCSASPVLPPAGGEGQSLQQQQQLGLWVIAGFLTFLALEKMLQDSKEKEGTSQVSGYLNLLANTIDNFTHGLAVAASFLVSKKIGLLTTMAILLHEIPHEVGDFAILLRAGFDRWSAAKLQLSTALGGLLGACFAICTQSPKGVGTGVVGGGGPRRGPSQRAQLPRPLSRPGSAPSVPCGSGCCTWLAWAPSRSGLLLPLQRRPWPGSCPSPLAASSTSPW